jgi:hypothetical protein
MERWAELGIDEELTRDEEFMKNLHNLVGTVLSSRDGMPLKYFTLYAFLDEERSSQRNKHVRSITRFI